jgi:hypothetical protein
MAVSWENSVSYLRKGLCQREDGSQSEVPDPKVEAVKSISMAIVSISAIDFPIEDFGWFQGAFKPIFGFTKVQNHTSTGFRHRHCGY